MSRRTFVLIAMLGVAVGAMPVVFHWLVIGMVPTATVREAMDDLNRPGSRAALVDVRAPGEFAEFHIEGAVNWPLESIRRAASPADVPGQLRSKGPLLLICNSGIQGALATTKLEREVSLWARNVRGGMVAWIAGGGRDGRQSFCKLRTASGDLRGLPFRELSVFDQFMAVVTGITMKSIYMLLALALVVILWRRKSPDLTALRWGLVFFFVGEFFCAVNYAVCNDDSFFSEYVHSFGMLLSFGFGTYAFFEGLDLRLVHYSDRGQKCAALGLCRACVKHADVPCGLRRLFLVLIPAHIVLAFIPLTARPHLASYNTRIFGTFCNYSHHGIYQLFEIRYCPIVAVVLFSASFAVLLLKKRNPVQWSKVLFAAGMGPFAFGVLRLVLFAVWRDNLLWFAGWEEITEFMYVVGVAVLLWIFRRGCLASVARLRLPRKKPTG